MGDIAIRPSFLAIIYDQDNSKQAYLSLSSNFAQDFLFPYTIPLKALFLIPFFRNLATY